MRAGRIGVRADQSLGCLMITWSSESRRSGADSSTNGVQKPERPIPEKAVPPIIPRDGVE